MKRKLLEDDIFPSKKKYQNTVVDLDTAEHQNFNKFLTDPLSQLATIEKNKGDINRYSAYTMACAQLKAYHKRIESGVEAQKLKGIGKAIAKKIQEIIDTGHMKKLENSLKDEKIVTLNEISKISGIGPKKAAELVFDMGVTSVNQLKQMVVDESVKLHHHALLGLQYYDDMQLRIPRDECTEIVNIVKSEANKLDPNLIIKCCGSYRRGLESSGDVDFLITHPNYTQEQKKKNNTFDILSRLKERLTECGLIKHEMTSGDMKFMGLCKIGDNPFRHIDLILYPVESYFCGLCHFTGSAEHNRKLRAVALQRGYKLNEYGIYPVGIDGEEGEPFPVFSERDIFGILGVEYRSPHRRNL